MFVFRSFFIKIFLLFSLCLFLNSIAKAKPVIERWTTKNGVPVYFVHRAELPIVDISLIFRAGSAQGDNPDVASLTATMLDQGTHTLSADQIAERFESVGARYQAELNVDQINLWLRSLNDPKLLTVALNTFSSLTHQANFPQNALRRIKKQQQTAWLEKQANPSYLANKRFLSTLYHHHPYAKSTTSTPQTIEKISRTDVVNFYQHYFVANNAGIAIVGAVDKNEAQAIAEKIASHLRQGTRTPALPVPQSYPKPDTVFVPYPSQQTTLIVGQLGVSFTDPDYPALKLGNQILGGGILTSRLFEEVRNKRGLVYGVRSHFLALAQPGPFNIWLQTRNDQVSTALTVVKTTLRDFVTQGPSEQELQAAKQAIIGSYPLSVASNAAILSSIEPLVFYQLPTDYWDEYLHKIQKLTLLQVKQAFNKVINPDKLLTIQVGPKTS